MQPHPSPPQPRLHGNPGLSHWAVAQIPNPHNRVISEKPAREPRLPSLPVSKNSHSHAVKRDRVRSWTVYICSSPSWEVLFCFYFSESFFFFLTKNRCWILSDAFLFHQLIWLYEFFFLSLLIWWITVSNIKPGLYSWCKPLGHDT